MISLIISCLLMSLGVAYAEDALSRYDDIVISAAVMEKCHLVVSDNVDQEKLREDGKAAFNALGGNHQELARNADAALKTRTEALMARVDAVASSGGCERLIGHAREVLESYRQ